jgi:hypothetical protein
LANPAWIKAKGILFLFLGILSGTALWLDQRNLKALFLLAITIWSFCRFYYFAFYVLERYVDPSFRFSGLLSLGRHLFLRKKPNRVL